MKIWILQRNCGEYNEYVKILGVYDDELIALRRLNKMPDKFDIEVVEYETTEQKGEKVCSQ